MSMIAEREMAHSGETKGAEDHDHDMIHELGKRLDALWRYDQYVANTDGEPQLQQFWRDLKTQERKTVQRLKQLVAMHCEKAASEGRIPREGAKPGAGERGFGGSSRSSPQARACRR
jgi:hypothetical protein